MVYRFVLSLVLLLVCCAVFGGEEPGAFLLFDFNKPEQVSVWTTRELAHVESVDSPWDGHGKALKMTIDKWSTNHEMWPAAIVSDAGIPNMADTVLFRKLKMKVRNIGDTPAVFFMHFFTLNWERYSTPGGAKSFSVDPGQDLEVVVDLRPGGIRQIHIATEMPANSFSIAVDDITLSPGLDTIYSKVSSGLRTARLYTDQNIPAGQYREQVFRKIAGIDKELAAVQKEFTTTSSPKAAQIKRWFARLDSISSAVTRLKCEPGKVRVRQYIKSTGIKDDWTLGTESAMTKVSYDSLPFVGELGKTLVLDGAKGETVHGQVVVIPTGRALSKVQFKGYELFGPDKYQLPMQIRVVGYLNVKEQGRYDVSYVGWWPDPLLDHLKSFNVPSNAQQPLWVSVVIPKHALPGLYKGTITVTPAGCKPQRVAVSLRVRHFQIPKQRHMKLAINYEEAEAARLHGKAWNDTLKWKYRDFLLSHRFNVDSIYQILPMWDESVADLKRLKAGGQDFFTAAVFNNTNGPGWHEKVAAFMQRAKEAGIVDMCWFYGYDESSEGSKPDILYHAKACHDLYPKSRTMTTADPKMMKYPEMVDVIDAWVPTTQSYYELGDLISNVRTKGKQVWYYVCIGPGQPYANLFIERSGIEPRLLLGFMAAKSGTDGFLYYSLNRAPTNNKPIDDGPLCSYNPASYQEYNGDGCIFYSGVNGPVSTIRMENIRDGLEDYEVWYMLREQLKQTERMRFTKQAQPALDNARRVLKIPSDLVRDLTDFTYSSKRLETYRTQLNDAEDSLEALGISGIYSLPNPASPE